MADSVANTRDGSLPGAPAAASSGSDSTIGVPDDSEVTFWHSQLNLSFLVAFGEISVVMGYLAVTPHGHHRVALWILASSVLALGSARLVFVPHVLGAKVIRLWFSFSWAVFTIAFIVVATMLDGSLDSPLRSLLIVPVVFAGLLYPPAYAVCTALAATSGAIIVTTTDPGVGVEWHFVIIDFAVLVGVGLCSVIASVGRVRLQNETHRLNAELQVLATTDPLTGCLNRRSFDAVCRSEVARAYRYGHKLTLMTIDIDKLKLINDTNGHAAGDQVLFAFGAALTQTTRAGDAVARLGGDEFAILMPDTDPSGAIDRARRIRSQLQKVPEIELTFSCGVSDLGPGRSAVSDLSEVADRALYTAKRAGGDLVAWARAADALDFETIRISDGDALTKELSTGPEYRNGLGTEDGSHPPAPSPKGVSMAHHGQVPRHDGCRYSNSPRSNRMDRTASGCGDTNPPDRPRELLTLEDSMDSGTPISYLAIKKGTPVHSSDGHEFGTVEHVLQDNELDLFDGLVLATRHGLRFIDRDQIVEITTTVIRSSLSDDEAAKLPKPEGPTVFQVDGLQDVGPSLSAHLGRMFRREHWTVRH